jgi:hypothetical protein
MLIQEVFDALRHGELSQLAIATGDDGNIPRAKYPALLSHLQLGLTALYRRFLLREGRMRLVMIPGTTLYQLNREYAQSNTRSRKPVKYLHDQAEPFMDELMKLERVLTDAEYEINLNVERDPWSAFTPTTTSLRLPKALTEQKSDVPLHLKTADLTLVYRANHPKIDVEDFDIDSTTIDLPETYLEPLLYFIAARVHTPIGTPNEGQVGMNWVARYEAACRELENQGLDIEQGGANERLYRNGWA